MDRGNEDDDGIIRFRTPPPALETVCERAIELLPEGNRVIRQHPDGPNRRWVHWSRDTWRWLG